MNILAVDTAAVTASVALFEDDVSVFEKSVTVGLTHSETLMPMIDEALKSARFTASDIDLYAVSNGPGSFTGIRIGVAAVKGLAYAVCKRVCGVNTLLALANNVGYASIPVCPIMDARRSEVYNAIYRFDNGKAEIIVPPRAVSVETLCESITSPVLFVGDGVRVYKEKITSLLHDFAVFAPPQLRLQKAASVAYAAMDMGEESYVSPAELEVVYLRKSQAEREREDKEKEKMRKDLVK